VAYDEGHCLLSIPTSTVYCLSVLVALSTYEVVGGVLGKSVSMRKVKSHVRSQSHAHSPKVNAQKSKSCAVKVKSHVRSQSQSCAKSKLSVELNVVVGCRYSMGLINSEVGALDLSMGSCEVGAFPPSSRQLLLRGNMDLMVPSFLPLEQHTKSSRPSFRHLFLLPRS